METPSQGAESYRRGNGEQSGKDSFEGSGEIRGINIAYKRERGRCEREKPGKSKGPAVVEKLGRNDLNEERRPDKGYRGKSIEPISRSHKRGGNCRSFGVKSKIMKIEGASKRRGQYDLKRQ